VAASHGETGNVEQWVDEANSDKLGRHQVVRDDPNAFVVTSFETLTSE